MCFVGFCVRKGSCCDPSSRLLLDMVAPTTWYTFCARILVINHLIPVAFDVENHIDTYLSIFLMVILDLCC
jgi:hypothetical protein